MIAAGFLFSKQTAAIDRKAKAKDTGVLNAAKRNEKRVDFDSQDLRSIGQVLPVVGNFIFVEPRNAAPQNYHC